MSWWLVGIAATILWLLAGWQGGRWVRQSWANDNLLWSSANEWFARVCIAFGPIMLIVGAAILASEHDTDEPPRRSWFK